MSKRKHSEIEDRIEKISDRAVRIKASRLQAKISHGTKSLKDALNLARGFERQKMGRRQKQASSEPHTLLRLREEVIVLKELDLAKTAGDYLLKQMVKTKSIRESTAFVALFGEDAKVEGPGSAAVANVLGRLFKARPVLDVVPGIIDGIRQVLGLDGSKALESEGQAHRAAEDQKQEKEEIPDKGVATEDDFEGFSDEALPMETNGAGQSEDELDDADLKAYSDMLAGSSGESEDDDKNTKDDLDPMEISDEEGLDHDREAYGSSSDSETAQGRQPPSKKPLTTPANTITSTSFLPSLSLGGYYSGSDSDDLDDRDLNRGPALPKDRKNRRGQRARQKIAEAKFGKEAKHLQGQQKDKDIRSSGWDARRGAVGSDAYDPRQRRVGKGGFARSKGPTGPNGEAVSGNRTARGSKPAAKKNDGPIHPSWEAAKKRKQETGQVAFAGKKITFD